MRGELEIDSSHCRSCCLSVEFSVCSGIAVLPSVCVPASTELVPLSAVTALCRHQHRLQQCLQETAQHLLLVHCSELKNPARRHGEGTCTEGSVKAAVRNTVREPRSTGWCSSCNNCQDKRTGREARTVQNYSPLGSSRESGQHQQLTD